MSGRSFNAAADEPEADAAAQPLTREEELAIGELGNEADDCGLLAEARLGQRELDLNHLGAALRGWERRRAGLPMR